MRDRLLERLGRVDRDLHRLERRVVLELGLGGERDERPAALVDAPARDETVEARSRVERLAAGRDQQVEDGQLLLVRRVPGAHEGEGAGEVEDLLVVDHALVPPLHQVRDDVADRRQ
jgi:hypothetical protein